MPMTITERMRLAAEDENLERYTLNNIDNIFTSVTLPYYHNLTYTLKFQYIFSNSYLINLLLIYFHRFSI